MKKVLFFACLIFLSSCINTNMKDDLNELSPTLQWSKSVFDSGSDDDDEIIPNNPQAFTLTADDNILVLMDTSMFQYNESGDFISSIKFNHSLNAVKNLDANGYLVIGNETSNLVVTKLDINLNQEWQQTHFVGNALIPNGIAELNNDLIISGLLNDDSWIIKLDIDGNLVWEKRFERSGSEIIKTIKRTSDNHIVAIGQTNSTDLNDLQGDFDVWAFKINTDGTTVWETILGGNDADEGLDINENIDGNYTLLASGDNNGDFKEIKDFEYNILVKLDANSGAIINMKGINGFVQAKLAIQDANNNFFMVSEGGTNNNAPMSENRDVTAVIKVNGAGERIWQINLDDSYFGQTPFAAMKTSKNELVVLSEAFSYSDSYLIQKIDSEN